MTHALPDAEELNQFIAVVPFPLQRRIILEALRRRHRHSLVLLQRRRLAGSALEKGMRHRHRQRQGSPTRSS